MKVMLTLAVTSFVLTAHGVQAQNDVVVGSSERPAFTSSSTAQQYTEKTGTFLTIEGNNAWIIDNGKKIAAEDGRHELVDGKIIAVKDGQVVGDLPEPGIINPNARAN